MRNNMFKKLILVLPAFMLVALAAVPAPAVELKIGSVDMQAVFNKCMAGQDALENLKNLAERETKEFQSKQEAFQKLEKEFERQRFASRPEALEEKERELLMAKRELEFFKEDTNRSMKRVRARLTAKIIKDLKNVVADYAKKNGYTLILETSEGLMASSGVVLYSDDSIDLTKTIVKLYDEQYKASKGGAKQ